VRTDEIAIVLLLPELEEHMDAFRTHGELLFPAALTASTAGRRLACSNRRRRPVDGRQQHGCAGVSGGSFERAFKLVQSVGSATRRAVFSNVAGKLAETAAGVQGAKIAIRVGDNIRIPDSLSKELLQEVKFTTSGKLGISDQLRDFIKFAKDCQRSVKTGQGLSVENRPF
jgi:hypothetical protein